VVFGNEYRVHVQEVIPVKSKAYRAVDVNRIELAGWLEGRDEIVVHAGVWQPCSESIAQTSLKTGRMPIGIWHPGLTKLYHSQIVRLPTELAAI
jgi:hypothetical protein